MPRWFPMCVVLVLWLVPSLAHALGTFTCSSPCVNGDSEVGNGASTTDPMTISSAVAGRPILVAIRSGGGSPPTPTINNGSNPGTLSWTLLKTQTPVGSDWVHAVYCAMVPTNGTYTFSATNSALGIRAWTAQYDTGDCSGALSNSHSNFGTSISAGTVSPTGSALIFSAIASDTDIDGQSGGRSLGSGTIRNNDCNTTPGLEPDQKGCIGDKGVQAAGTYNATWTVGSDIWTAIIVALPTSGGGSGGGPIVMFITQSAVVIATFLQVLFIGGYFWERRTPAVQAAVKFWRYAADVQTPKEMYWAYRYKKAVKRWQRQAPLMLEHQPMKTIDLVHQKERARH